MRGGWRRRKRGARGGGEIEVRARGGRVEAEGRNDERAEFSGNRGEETGGEDLKFERVECG